MSFTIGSTEYRTSTYSDTDWTKQCVGVASECLCHTQLADSQDQEVELEFRNDEYAAFVASATK